MKELLIVTGPPGAGKTTFADTMPYTVYDQNNGNKALWRDSAETSILVTAAPSRRTKEFWCSEARRFGFVPKVLVVDPGRGLTTQQLLRRDMEGSLDDRRRARLSKSVQRWYSKYSRHPDEEKVEIVDAG